MRIKKPRIKSKYKSFIISMYWLSSTDNCSETSYEHNLSLTATYTATYTATGLLRTGTTTQTVTDPTITVSVSATGTTTYTVTDPCRVGTTAHIITDATVTVSISATGVPTNVVIATAVVGAQTIPGQVTDNNFIPAYTCTNFKQTDINTLTQKH